MSKEEKKMMVSSMVYDILDGLAGKRICVVAIFEVIYYTD